MDPCTGRTHSTDNVELKEMSYEILKSITNGFSENKIVGSGTFGVVYEGALENGTKVAVKVLRDMAALDDKAFRDEFQNVARLKHQNIVQLLGYCDESEKITVELDDGTKTPAEKIHKALCFEYVDNGSLHKYISDENQGLEWHIRFKIIKGICEGLKHLRVGLNKPLWHLDLKPDNILLDRDMTPKIADFGIARLIIGDEKTRKTINCVGTCGYWPPEFVRFQFISEAFDIFSLGVIITKIMIGTKGYNECATMQPRNLVKHVHNNWKKKLHEVVNLREREVYCQQAKTCIEIASKCLAEDRKQRPCIQDIVDILREADETMIPQQIEQVTDVESILSSSEGDAEASAKIHTLINHLSINPTVLPLDKLRKITNNFSEDRLLGEGRFGRVYKGIFEDGQIVAVKLLKYAVEDNEVFRHTKNYLIDVVRHKNIIQLLEAVTETREEATEHNGKIVLVKRTRVANCSEYFRNGSLERYISDESHGLDWCTRYRIIKGTCDGLRYLHKEVNIIHVYLKPSNILLDENMVPKIGDISMTRFLGVVETKRTITSFGTMEHLPPEFITKQVISKKFDIYSLGIIIIKVMVGMSAHSLLHEMNSKEFIELVLGRWSKRLQVTSKGRSLDGYYQQVKKCLEIALECMEADMHRRPSIENIVEMLDETETLIPDNGDLLDVHPMELRFIFRPKKHISCLLQLHNKEDDSVAFRLLSNSPKRYLTQRPICGVVPSRCTYTLALTTAKQPQRPPSEKSDEGFVLQSIAVGCYQEHMLHDLDQASAVKEYDSLFKKASEIDGAKVQTVTLKCHYAPLADASSKLIGQGIMINATLHAQKVSSIDMHPTKPWILTTHQGGNLRLWDYQKMEEVLNTFEIPDEPVYVAKFIAREEWIVAGGDRGHIHVHSYDESQDATSFEAHNGRIMSLAVHPTDSYLLSSSHDDHLIKLWHWDPYWNFDKGSWECARTFQGHSSRVSQVIFNPDDNGSFASASWDCTAKLWSLNSDMSNAITLDDHSASILCVGYVIGDDREHLITGSKDGTAQIWDLGTKTCIENLRRHGNHISAVYCHPKHHKLMTGSLDGTVRIWDFTTYRLENIIDFNLGEVHDFGYIEESQRIVVGCHQGIAMMEINSLKPQLLAKVDME